MSREENVARVAQIIARNLLEKFNIVQVFVKKEIYVCINLYRAFSNEK